MSKGQGGGLINEKQLRREFDDWFSGSGTTPPAMLSGPSPAPAAGQKGTELEEKRLAEQIEAALDRDFKTAVEGVYNGLEAKGQDKPATKGVGSLASTDSLISPDAADMLFDRSPVKTKGLLSWAKVATFVAKVVIACIKRMSSGRSHGIYPTLVEEVLRAAYADKIGITLWNSMKRDTADAFAKGEETGGFALLEELKALRDKGHSFTKITLIGHSTGAIYICHLLAAAARQLAGQQFDLIFLAPAVTHELFAETVTSHRQLIGNFRMFAMRDEVECKDSMVKILYTRSLLYFVSGLLESEPDTPVVGMQRFINETDLFTPEKFPAIATVAAFFEAVPQAKVWSITTGPPGTGTSSAAEAHGDFDDDEPTRDSMVDILKKGF